MHRQGKCRICIQVVTVDRQGFLALYRAVDAALVATKRVSTDPLVVLRQCGPDAYAIATDHAVSIWRIRRELPYNVFRGGHTAAVLSLYACSGGLVRFCCAQSHHCAAVCNRQYACGWWNTALFACCLSLHSTWYSRSIQGAVSMMGSLSDDYNFFSTFAIVLRRDE